MKKHDVKGKKKAPSSPPKLKKKNADRDQAVVKRKHKKPVATQDTEEGSASGKCTLSPGCPRTAQGGLET